MDFFLLFFIRAGRYSVNCNSEFVIVSWSINGELHSFYRSWEYRIKGKIYNLDCCCFLCLSEVGLGDL